MKSAEEQEAEQKKRQEDKEAAQAEHQRRVAPGGAELPEVLSEYGKK